MHLWYSLSFSVDLTQSSKVVEVIQRGDLLRSLRSLRELQAWSAPPLLAHLHRSVHVFLSNTVSTFLHHSCDEPCKISSLLFPRLYEKHGEAAVRSFSQFYPTITPADVMTMAQKSHFLAYLDNLVQSRTEGHRYIFSFILLSETKRQWTLLVAEFYNHFFLRLSFLQSLLEPESLRQDWLELALTHDAPQRCDTLTPDGQPRSGYVYLSFYLCSFICINS